MNPRFSLWAAAERKLFWIYSAVIFVCCSGAVHAELPIIGPPGPEHFHWRGTVKGEVVNMDIEAGIFVPGDHKIRHNGDQVDGYSLCPYNPTGCPPTVRFYTIKKWTLQWGGKRIGISPRGAYASLFNPDLHSPTNGSKEADGDAVIVQVSRNGRSLSVTMGCGRDGIVGTVAFVITKDGRIRRYVVGVGS